MDASAAPYFVKAWKDKLAAAFTVSGSPSGDKLNTLTSLAIFAAQHGMLWIGTGQGCERPAYSPGWPAGSFRDRSRALMATTTVLRDMSTAPMAGLNSTPQPANTPAARGMVSTL